MSADADCSNINQDNNRWKLYRHPLAVIGYLIILILFVIFLIFLILRPSKPSFTLQDVKLYTFNISTTTLITSTLQITISSRNPNSRIGIYYDKVSMYASYRSQQITLPTIIPPTYQGHKDVVVWSPFLYGTEVPMAPYIATSLAQDETAGMVLVDIKATGRVRWKVGTFVTGGYRLNVNCPAHITFGNNGAVTYQFDEGCHVEV